MCICENLCEQSPILVFFFLSFFLSGVQVRLFVLNFLDVIFQIIGRHAGGTDRGSSQYDAHLKARKCLGWGWGQRGRCGKLKCHKDINRDRMWPPVATAKWIAGEIQSQPVQNRLIQWKWQQWSDRNQLLGCTFPLSISCHQCRQAECDAL